MERNSAEALVDFSGGCFFASLLVCCIILYAARHRSRLHALATYLFGWLAAMNVVLFVLYYVKNFLGAHLAPIANLYQATCIPLCVCLMYEMARPGQLTKRGFWLNVVPSLLAPVLYMCTLSDTLYIVCISLAICYGMVGMAWSAFELRRYNRSIQQWSSYTDGVKVTWVFHVLLAFLMLFVVWTAASYMNVNWANAFYNFCCCVIFTVVAICLRRHEVVSIGTEQERRGAGETHEEAEAEAGKNYHFKEKFLKAFEEEQVYLEPKLTITMLAERLHTNRTYLSNYINTELQVSFYEYVNRYRIARAKEMLEAEDYTVEGICTMCGFNSLSAFRRTFSAMTGMPPGQYRRDHSLRRDSPSGEAECPARDAC